MIKDRFSALRDAEAVHAEYLDVEAHLKKRAASSYSARFCNSHLHYPVGSLLHRNPFATIKIDSGPEYTLRQSVIGQSFCDFVNGQQAPPRPLCHLH